VRSGTLTATAKPITRGRHSQLWHVEVRDSDGKVVAEGDALAEVLEAR